MITILLILAVCFLAYTNGANDNFKGVATLYGSDTIGYRAAIRWGTMCTFCGSICSIFVAQALLIAFSGKGLVPSELVGSQQFLSAVAFGAGTTVLIATVAGLPISTTHSLIGAFIGSGIVAASGDVAYQLLLSTFLAPLIVSPLVALVLGAAVYLVARYVRLRLGITKEWCICIGNTERIVPIPQPDSMLAVDTAESALDISVGPEMRCRERYVGRVFGANLQKMVDAFHFLSAGIVSFARGLNDTPKIAALLLLVQSLDTRWGLVGVAMAIAVGGLLGARKVGETMAHRITDMNHGQAVSANLATGLLVIAASIFGLPVSTTHVSVGSLFGIGFVTRSAKRAAIRNIVLSWVFTLPTAIVTSSVAYYVLNGMV